MKTNFPKNAGTDKNWLFLFFSLITFGLFALLAIHVKAGGVFVFDSEAFAGAFALRSYEMTFLMRGTTFLGSSVFLVPANIIMITWVLFFEKNQVLFALQWAITAMGSLLLMYFFKGIYERPRPLDPYLDAATGFSFPSGHTLNGLVFFGLVIYFLWKYAANKYLKIWGAAFLIIIILGIGASRIYLRVHYASDVLGGLTLGAGWLALSLYIFGALEKRRNKLTFFA